MSNVVSQRYKSRLYAQGMTGAQLESELADNYQRGAWRQLCTEDDGYEVAKLASIPSVMSIMAASPTAMSEMYAMSYVAGRIVYNAAVDAGVYLPESVKNARTVDALLADDDIARTVWTTPNVCAVLSKDPVSRLKMQRRFTPVANDETALRTVLGQGDAMALVYEQADSLAALRAGTGLPKVNNTTSTSYYRNVAPSGAAGYPDANLWDGNDATQWRGLNSNNPNVRMALCNAASEKVAVHTLVMQAVNDAAVKKVNGFGIDRSAHTSSSPVGAEWVAVGTFSAANSDAKQLFHVPVPAQTAAPWWRMSASSAHGTATLPAGISTFEFEGFLI